MSQPTLTQDELNNHLAHLPGWKQEGKTLVNQYEFEDFVTAIKFVNQLASKAEAINHHPDIDIRYNKVNLLLTTHDSGGITKNDVELAAAADEYAEAVK
jgi:4a-hydroxytetrahydrobiopterin dehydratase